MSSEFKSVISKFNQEHISYVIVGGLAVILHGHNRLTTDLDFIISLKTDNVEKVVSALESLNYFPKIPVNARDFGNPKTRKEWIEQKGMQVFGFTKKDNPLISVDLFAEYPIPYEELFKDSELKDIGSDTVRVCSIEHLIQLKQKAGRPKDLEDIRVLNFLKDYGQKN